MTNAEFDKWTAGWSGAEIDGPCGTQNVYYMRFDGVPVLDLTSWHPSSPDAPRWQLEVLEDRLDKLDLSVFYDGEIMCVICRKENKDDCYSKSRSCPRSHVRIRATTSERVAAMWAMKDEIEEAIENGHL
jgi:hypothetical protein